MQFRNAVLTPKGIELLGAANINKPVVFTRFLFTDATEPLFGSETDLPPNTWGNGSVDAVVNQGELGQFVIYASASNAVDYGYARGYGIYAKLRDEDTDHLVCVANALGNAVKVTESSGGYSRFHVALTIKYAVADNVVVVEPNLAGLISRGEFEDWVKRVVTKMSASGEPYGDDQTIYGEKTFRDNVNIGTQAAPRILNLNGSMAFTNSIIPNNIGEETQIGADQNPVDYVFAKYVIAEAIKRPIAALYLPLDNKLSNDSTSAIWTGSEVVSSGFVKFTPSDQMPPVMAKVDYHYRNVTINGQRVKAISNYIRSIEVALDATLPFVVASKIRWSIRIFGRTTEVIDGDTAGVSFDFAHASAIASTTGNIYKVKFNRLTAPKYSDMRETGAILTIIAEYEDGMI